MAETNPEDVSKQGAPRPMTDVQADIAKILADAKLPERRPDFRGAADSREAPPATPSTRPETAPATRPPLPERKDDGPVVPVRTLHHDLQSVVADTKLSLVQAAALEEDKRAHREPEPVSAQTDRTRHYTGPIMLGASLLGFGLLLLGAIAFIISEQTVGSDTQYGTSMIFSEQVAAFPLLPNPQDIKRSLASARAAGGLTLGSITRLVPTTQDSDPETGAPIEREATAQEFLRALDIRIPDELMRTLGDEFFFGFHTVDEQAPLLVFRVSSYERAFGGMLSWEKTLNADLSPFFTSLSPLVRNSEGLIVDRTYSDAVMQNYDVRTLKDDSGVIQLYYSFPTRSLLIIAESPYSFPELLSRLRAERKL